jgi:hypothetical protein
MNKRVDKYLNKDQLPEVSQMQTQRSLNPSKYKPEREHRHAGTTSNSFLALYLSILLRLDPNKD